MKVITLCFWRRPQYVRNCLHALQHCKGIGDYTLVAHLDGPQNEDIKAQVKAVDWAKTELVLNDEHWGCNVSTRRALSYGFNRAEYVIHVEEDVVLAPDALQYFEWAGAVAQNDPSVMSIAAWRHDSGWLPEHGPFPLEDNPAGKVVRWTCFHCWGWATWRDRWLGMNSHWTTGNDSTLSWDVALNQYRHETGRCELAPLISRAYNIGAAGGVHRGDSPLSYWAGSTGFVLPETYRIV